MDLQVLAITVEFDAVDIPRRGVEEPECGRAVATCFHL